MVSCIIPTGNRRALLPLAVRSFLSQDWPDKELVVVDDGETCESDLLTSVPRHIYARVPKMTIGAKRNVACQLASGEVIAHFDSDDWSAPGRLTDQVTRMMASDKQLSGYHTMCYWNMLTGKAYKYEGSPNYSMGTAMCYRKSFWASGKFEDKSFAEDNDMVFRARDAGQIISVDGTEMMVARGHDSNFTQVGVRLGNNAWPEVSKSHLPAAFFEAMEL